MLCVVDVMSRVLDLIPWVAGALAVMWAAMAVGIAVQWLRKLSGSPNPPGYRRGVEVPRVATGHADDVGGVR